MRIVFVVPFDPEPEYALGHLTLPPIRLACLAALGRKFGHEVNVIDGVGLGFGHRWTWNKTTHLHGLEIDDLIQRIPADIDVIGVSLMFSAAYPATRAFVHRLREQRPNTTAALDSRAPDGDRRGPCAPFLLASAFVTSVPA